jgi:hypothetical protein
MRDNTILVILASQVLVDGIADGKVPFEGESVICSFRDMSRFAQGINDPNVFVFSNDPEAPIDGTDGYHDAFGGVRLDEKNIIMGLQTAAYDNQAFQNWSLAFDKGLPVLGTTAFNAIMAPVPQSYFLSTLVEDGTWASEDVSARIQGRDLFGDGFVAIAYEGLMKRVTIQDALSYLNGELRLDWVNQVIVIGSDAKILPVDIGLVQVKSSDGYMTVYDETLTKVARHFIGQDRVVLPKIDTSGNRVNGKIVMVDFKLGRPITQIDVPLELIFGGNHDMTQVFQGQRLAASGK